MVQRCTSVRVSMSRVIVKGNSRPKDGAGFSRLKGGNFQENEAEEESLRVRGFVVRCCT